MSSLFSSALIASLTSNLLYFFTHLCDYAVESEFLENYHKILASFLPSIAMKRAFVNLIVYERAGKGVQIMNFNELYYGYRVGDAYYMFFVTFVLYFTVGVYLTNILRLTKEDSDESLRHPWYYPCLPSYWRGQKHQKNRKELKVHPILAAPQI